VAQPFNRTALLPALGQLDREAGEFWLPNPWAFGSSPHNLSAYERNRVFWNLRGQEFFDLSYISGIDSDADSRGFVSADLTGDGMPEIVLRNSGGGPLRIYRNEIPRQHYVRVSLRGTRSNRQGVGSKLYARLGERTIVREFYPANTYAAQGPAEVVFGLGDSTSIDELSIRWPSGLEQTLIEIVADRHVMITEGDPIPLVNPAASNDRTGQLRPKPYGVSSAPKNQ
jgi:hypothetical protein